MVASSASVRLSAPRVAQKFRDKKAGAAAPGGASRFSTTDLVVIHRRRRRKHPKRVCRTHIAPNFRASFQLRASRGRHGLRRCTRIAPRRWSGTSKACGTSCRCRRRPPCPPQPSAAPDVPWASGRQKPSGFGRKANRNTRPQEAHLRGVSMEPSCHICQIWNWLLRRTRQR